jgi:DNA adenine methylase
MKIKALAPCFGGKRTMAPLIVEQLGKHTQYFEPFCGSMAVIFGKQPSQKETVNDLHGDVTNLARVVQQEDTASALYERQQKVLFAEGLLRDAREILDRPIGEVDPLDRAYWFFLASWMMRNGVAGTRRLESLLDLSADLTVSITLKHKK